MDWAFKNTGYIPGWGKVSTPALDQTQLRKVKRGGAFTGIKQLEPEADHSPPYRAEFKNDWIYRHSPHTPWLPAEGHI
jgi:hypothetical protein